MHPVGAVNVASSTPIDRRVAREAAEWAMRLSTESVQPVDLVECERWRARDPEHERAWQRAQQMSCKLRLIPAEIGLPTLTRPAASRRDVLKLLTLAIAAPAGVLAFGATPWREWTADYRTATGERSDLSLPDGSQLQLNTASAVDVAFDRGVRLLKLRAGEILVATAPDTQQPPRPFMVTTREGRLRALGTRFLVRQYPEHSQVAVFEGAVEVRPHDSDAVHVIQVGEQTRFDAREIDNSISANPHAAAWVQGVLRADRMRLADFAAELSRYRPGWLRCDPAVAELRVSGVFQLSDTDEVLRALPSVLPVQVTFNTAYWTVIGAKTL